MTQVDAGCGGVRLYTKNDDASSFPPLYRSQAKIRIQANYTQSEKKNQKALEHAAKKEPDEQGKQDELTRTKGSTVTYIHKGGRDNWTGEPHQEQVQTMKHKERNPNTRKTKVIVDKLRSPQKFRSSAQSHDKMVLHTNTAILCRRHQVRVNTVKPWGQPIVILSTVNHDISPCFYSIKQLIKSKLTREWPHI